MSARSKTIATLEREIEKQLFDNAKIIREAWAMMELSPDDKVERAQRLLSKLEKRLLETP